MRQVARWMCSGTLLAACAGGGTEGVEEVPQTYGPYEATVRYTSFGVPHILAADRGSLAYAHGYVMSQDHGCVIGDRVLEVTSRRSMHLGPGPEDAHIDSDFGWLALGVYARAEAEFDNLSPAFRDAMVGFAAGYNAWLAEGDLPAACAGASWMTPLTPVDMLTYMLALTLDGSGAVWVREIGRAQPPNAVTGGSAASVDMAAEASALAEVAKRVYDPQRGSNGWALGSDKTTNSQGALLSNTHFPYVGEKQWYEAHLTIPGEVDVYGASLIGVPVINVGFNKDVAWTHTVSYTPRFVAYFLTLQEGDPLTYSYDGGTRALEGTEYQIEVLDGSDTRTQTRTLYRSHYGPVIDAPVIGWSDTMVVSFRDVNADNLTVFDVWQGMNTATSMDAFVAVHEQTTGIPWVYTLAASKEGEAFFGDTSRAPNLTPEALAAWQTYQSTNLIAGQFAAAGVIAVDGADPIYAWADDPAATDPGLMPPSQWPMDRRTDYVLNANDSHWLHNAQEPLEGYSVVYGEERTPRSGRTLMNARILDEVAEGGASGADGRFDLQELEAAALSARSLWAEEALHEVVARCTATPTYGSGDSAVDLTQACEVLAGWDGTYRTEAVGAVLWREFLGAGEFERFDLAADGGGLFTTPFDPDMPLATPTDVVPVPKVGDDPILRALVGALAALEDAGFAPDVSLGEAQRLLKDPTVALPGANYWEGTHTIADHSGSTTNTLLPYATREGLGATVVNEDTELTDQGYLVNNGNSWVLAMRFGDNGPEARAAMVYSQSEDPRSAHFSDQGAAYGAGSLRPVAFTEAEIAADTQRTVELTVEEGNF